MNREFHIYAIVTTQEVTFIGCTKGDVPPEAIKLQTVSEHPEANWVKWCVRFRRTLKDRRGVEHPLAELFTNHSRIKRLLDADAVMRLEAKKCRAFLTFHSRHPQVFANMVTASRAEKAAGRIVYAAEAHLSDARWSSDLGSERSPDRFKINSDWAAWYSRLIQMSYPDLIGFFRLRISLADGLVVGGRSWRAFAEEHADQLHYELFESIPDSDWEYNV